VNKELIIISLILFSGTVFSNNNFDSGNEIYNTDTGVYVCTMGVDCIVANANAYDFILKVKEGDIPITLFVEFIGTGLIFSLGYLTRVIIQRIKDNKNQGRDCE